MSWWVAKCQYEGKKEFVLGSVIAENTHEALKKFEELWGEISPHQMPQIIEIQAGRLVIITGRE